MTVRIAAGIIIACAIAFTAVRAGSLSRSGAAAAIVVGTVCMAAGWGWGVLLIAFFVTSSALSRLRSEVKLRRTEAIIAKGGARDAIQVLANGGIFTLAAALSILTPWDGWLPIGVGALAAATADTWGTEIGTLAAAPPWLITTGQRVQTGTSGGVSLPGLFATVAGALCIAALVWLLHWPPRVALAAAGGGIAGALADSVIGALWQVQRWCALCQNTTERLIHTCGTVTERRGKIAWLDNDAVNLVSGAFGAAVALLITR